MWTAPGPTGTPRTAGTRAGGPIRATVGKRQPCHGRALLGHVGAHSAGGVPSAFTRPSRTSCNEEETVPDAKAGLPAMTSGMAAVPPGYGARK